MARAAALDAQLHDLPITDVVVSQLQRTRLTASVFITRTNATVHVVPIGPEGVPAHVKAVADTVRAIMTTYGHTGVLVVGHSNTVTPIVQALGGPAMPSLCDAQYSLFINDRNMFEDGYPTGETFRWEMSQDRISDEHLVDWEKVNHFLKLNDLAVGE